MTADPARAAYEARWAGMTLGSCGAAPAWDDLGPEGRAVWERVAEAVSAAAAEQPLAIAGLSSEEKTMPDQLPAPRLQLRWAEPTPKDEDDFQFTRTADPASDNRREWICHYELILPLREHDIRRENEEGEDVRSELALLINRCMRTSTETCPADTPFRDGVHARWDSSALGGIPIFVIAADGSVHEQKRVPSPASEE